MKSTLDRRPRAVKCDISNERGGLLGQEASLARVRKRSARVGRVDLARQPMPIEDAVRNQPWRDTIADRVHRLERPRTLPQLPVELVVGGARGDEHHGIRVDPPLTTVGAEQALPRADRYELGVDRRFDAEVDEPLPDRYPLLGVVEERADDAERRDVVDATTAGGEQLGDTDAHEVALAVVDEDESAGGLLAGEDALGR